MLEPLTHQDQVVKHELTRHTMIQFNEKHLGSDMYYSVLTDLSMLSKIDIIHCIKTIPQ